MHRGKNVKSGISRRIQERRINEVKRGLGNSRLHPNSGFPTKNMNLARIIKNIELQNDNGYNFNLPSPSPNTLQRRTLIPKNTKKNYYSPDWSKESDDDGLIPMTAAEKEEWKNRERQRQRQQRQQQGPINNSGR